MYYSYFIDLNDKTLADQCESFENGICDNDFNSMNFRYDGGVSLLSTNCFQSHKKKCLTLSVSVSLTPTMFLIHFFKLIIEGLLCCNLLTAILWSRES